MLPQRTGKNGDSPNQVAHCFEEIDQYVYIHQWQGIAGQQLDA